MAPSRYDGKMPQKLLKIKEPLNILIWRDIRDTAELKLHN